MVKKYYKQLSFLSLTGIALSGHMIMPAAIAQVTSNTPAQSAQPSNTSMNTFPLSSTVSYDSLRIMAYSGKSEQAIKLAEEYLKTHDSLEIRTLLARMLGWDKQYDAAREQLQYVLGKNPGDYDASDTLADIEVWNGNYNRAIDVINNALKYHLNNESLIEKREIIRAKMLVAAGQRSQAIQVAQDYLKTHDTPAMHVYLGNLFLANKQYDDARKQFGLVLGKKPSYTDASDGLADLYISRGNYQAALQVINDGLKYAPTHKTLLDDKTLVMAKLNPGKSPPLAATTGAQPTVTPSSTNVTYDQLEKMAHSGQRKKAIELAEDYLKQNDSYDVHILLGLMLSWNGQYDAARTQFQYVLNKNPSNSDASKGLANVEIWSGSNDQALIVINKALKYHPNDKTLLQQKQTALGKSKSKPSGITYDEIKYLAHNNQRPKAEKLAEQYLSKNENADVRVLLGLMYSWDGDYDKSRQQFEIVLNDKPGYTDASLGLANVEVWTNNYSDALRVVDNALKYHPQDKTLLEKRTSIIQDINSTYGYPGIHSLFNLPGLVGPYTSGQKLNAISFDQEMSYVDDLKETWKISSLAYERYTRFGSVIFTFNRYDRFKSAGTQYLVEAYPHLFPGAYLYIGYGYSNTSYIARHYVGFEPFFSLPHAFEFSAGERLLYFQGGPTHLYTGSIAKYIGNWWFALRPYISDTASHSYYFTARRYFSSPDSYISLTVGGGSGPSFLDVVNPNNLSSDRSRSVRLDGEVPLMDNLIFTWLVAYSTEHFPNTNVRQETDVDAGFIYRY